MNGSFENDGVCDCCGETKKLDGKGWCETCLVKAQTFETLVDKITAFAKTLQAEGYSKEQLIGALESAGELL